ncbi:uncharacterized protein L3040_005963 [Drepanopeziza brunnea f. sp. 'multigermtubi']|uniref:uncharacterized protein n=2 Tax=Drepanopeziza brunnea f. sp. 'multigermtubi' TaxID=698441 RepID=UPI0023853C54|nr:hypothetical protein L3040_005963 [Drepanopeziza brunnea f. sp. 'multigermtubi']
MSDLVGGGPSPANSRGGDGRPQLSMPGGSGSPSIKGPRDIMRERNAREARKRAEMEQKEASERARAAEEQRLIDVENRRSGERRAAAAAAAAAAAQRGSGESTHKSSGGTAGQRVSDGSQRERRSGDHHLEEAQGFSRGGRASGGGESAARPRPTQQQSQDQHHQPRGVQPEPMQRSIRAGTGAPPAQSQTAATRSSFPHAFERWENLSAHWEGLTSFWLRRLEENGNEINRDPLSQQLSRQVTDLSAAGANLFHAVVELQRLRASSERKFQRWFFETRAEQERHQEIQALTQASLEQERAKRNQEMANANAKEREKCNVEKQLAEMKRELQISKEEARRAWDELGRREQEEREKTASLRDGQPTMLGGVQVVPMMQGVPSRHGSSRDAPRDTGNPTRQPQSPEGPIEDSDINYQQYSRAQRSEPADPFVTSPNTRAYTEASLPAHPAFSNSHPQSPAPAVQPASTAAYYQEHQSPDLQSDATYRQPSVAGEGSEAEYEIDSQGRYVRDDRGNKIRYHVPGSEEEDDEEEYDEASEREREAADLLHRYGEGSAVEYGRGATPTSSAPSNPPAVPSVGEPDYAGAGYGNAPEWAGVPRHHHPTRLSDVLEEDERSRTSASLISRRD